MAGHETRIDTLPVARLIEMFVSGAMSNKYDMSVLFNLPVYAKNVVAEKWYYSPFVGERMQLFLPHLLGPSRNDILEEEQALAVPAKLLRLLNLKPPWQILGSTRSCRSGKIRSKPSELPIGKKTSCIESH